MGGLPKEPIPDPHEPQTEGLQIGDHRLSTSSSLITIVVMTLDIKADYNGLRQGPTKRVFAAKRARTLRWMHVEQI